MLLIILGAVSDEIQGLVRALRPSESFDFLGDRFHVSRQAGLSVMLGSTGLGKVNGATVASALLQRFSVHQVWNVGCCGAYRDGPLACGDVLISTKIFLGDEGVLTCAGTLPAKEIGIPVLTVDGEGIYDSIPLGGQAGFSRWLERTPEGTYERSGIFQTAANADGGIRKVRSLFRVFHGPSLTVSMVSGDEKTASRRFQHYGAFAESMEGSGIAQACFRHGVPMIECRGVSNLAGDRDKSRWNFEQAFSHCHTIVLNWLDGLGFSRTA